MPDTAEWIVGGTPSAILESPAWSAFVAERGIGHDVDEVLTRLRSCGITPEELNQVIIGATLDNQFTAILTGPEVGRQPAVSCLLRELEKAFVDGQVTHSETQWSEDPRVPIIQYSDGRVYLLSNDVMAMTTTAWEPELDRLAICEGQPALGGSFAPLSSRIRSDASVWVRAKRSALEGMVSPDLPTPSALVVNFFLETDLEFELEAGFSNPDTASQLAARLRNGFPEVFTEAHAQGPTLFVRGHTSLGALVDLFDGREPESAEAMP